MPEKTRTKESSSSKDGTKKEKANTHKLALKGVWFACGVAMVVLTDVCRIEQDGRRICKGHTGIWLTRFVLMVNAV
jgi:hypothetical protein